MVLRVGTDYSGIEAPIVALKRLGVGVDHIFSSEICPIARKVIEDKFRPRTLYGDALLRGPRSLPSHLDLYVAGFPCQIFSPINNITGRNRNPRRPLRHFVACLDTIRRCKPHVFVLENVPGLLTAKSGAYGAAIKRELAPLGRRYHVSLLVLNSRDYGSLQHRSRIFIVGVSKTRATSPIRPPPRVSSRRTFVDILEKGRGLERPRLSPKEKARFDRCARQYPHPVFMSKAMMGMRCSGSPHPPCLTRHGKGIYWSKRGIITTVREDMRLQGFPEDFRFPAGISNTRARELVGNSMSVDVLKALFREIFKRCKGFKTRGSS
jgi:site-specific DNA-cytosine methylase